MEVTLAPNCTWRSTLNTWIKLSKLDYMWKILRRTKNSNARRSSSSKTTFRKKSTGAMHSTPRLSMPVASWCRTPDGNKIKSNKPQPKLIRAWLSAGPSRICFSKRFVTRRQSRCSKLNKGKSWKPLLTTSIRRQKKNSKTLSCCCTWWMAAARKIWSLIRTRIKSDPLIRVEIC